MSDDVSNDAQSARDDLAFLRAIAGGDDEGAQSKTFGETYFLAGLIYGGQMLLHAAEALGLLPNTPPIDLAIGVGPTVLFVPLLIWVLWRNRRQRLGGAAGRAVAGAFGAVGIANLLLILVVGSIAWRTNNLTTWLIFPCCVFVLQGTAWQVAFVTRRRAWFAAVALGWYASAVAMALSIFALGWYILFAGLGLWFCMALPGWLMLRGRTAQ